MVEAPGDWYRVYEDAMHELDDDNRRALSEQARIVIQDRLLACQITSERTRLERALRELWELENRAAGRDQPN